MKGFAYAFVFLPIAAGCSSGAPSSSVTTVPSSATQITGVLRAAGGTSRAVDPGFPGLVRAVHAGRTIASVSTKPDGSFALTVDPGTYLVIGGWKDACAAPCDWQAGCGQSAPVLVTKVGVSGLTVVCRLK